MSPGSTFERVYLALKAQLRAGRFAPGDRLEPALLGDDLNSSVTPVRDALHRLVGERIVEAPRHDGFRCPLLTERGLRQLYDWQSDLLLLALRSRNLRAIPPEHPFWQDEPAAPAGGDEPAGGLFRHLVGASGNSEHSAALANLADRLAPSRVAEAALVADPADEADGLRQALRARDLRRLRDLILHYHRRRARLVPELVAAVHANASDGA